MKAEFLIILLLPLFLLAGCSEKDDPPAELPDGCISLKDLETKHDYYLPFAIVNDSNLVSRVFLNGKEINLATGCFVEFKETGFYEIVVIYTDRQKPADTFLFTTKTPERENSEWGIREWIPAPFVPVLIGTENIEVFYPRHFSGDIGLPFIFFIRESGALREIWCEGKCLETGDDFNIKMGTGSVYVASSSIDGNVDFRIGGRTLTVTLSEAAGTSIELTGIIDSPVEIPANSVVRVTGNLEIAGGGSLVVHEGVLIIIGEGIDINVDGPVIFAGTPDNPVYLTSDSKESYWGGFISRSSEGTIRAEYTIFSRSGFHDSEGYNWGHSGRQALFYTENSTLDLYQCFITDHVGQVFYPQNSTLLLDNILVQRVQTGGQINNSQLYLSNSVFTDFPDDKYVYADEDNDALYLNATDAVIENTLFMFAKDDGLDSGMEEGGTITVTNCRFEACFHEGAALSSAGTVEKEHIFTDCMFINCGQGLELGFSSQNHTVTADKCLFLYNGTGIRYGDNYEWSEVNGKMSVKNSFSLYNDRDVWNMVRKTWSPKLQNLTFENTRISKPSSQYPELETYKE
ncbi:MAG: hypothetical protein JXR67_06370 [Bacteroidales bacterium]|nr:hypothetical protein [Bacteroidales bacterium]